RLFATVPYLSLHHKIMNDRSMAVLFSYAVRAWKATTPELNGHRPQIAGNRNAERIARPSPLPAKP
ncbi:hypothetical protein, partial [Klebsiella quasipneumoniae]|uniref:hypothetical protein n=4 Tax=Enterobacterales TaxID=91347 RepID=UPI001D0D0C3A